MNIQQISYVVEVYNKHSFSEAARSLYVSQPSLSQSILSLEEELGFEIFERSRKGVSATTVKGYQFIKQSQRILQQFSALEHFRTDASSSFHLSSTVISQAQDAFLRLGVENISNPHLDVDLWFAGCNESAERVKDGLSDMGVVTIIEDQFDEWTSYFKSIYLTYEDLGAYPFRITVHADSPLAQKKIIRNCDLEGYTYITEKCSRMNNLTLEVYAMLDRICPEARITVSNTEIMYELLASTAKHRTFILDTIPLSLNSIEKHNLVSIPLEGDYKAHLGYITHESHHLSGISKRYIELLKEELEKSI